jgi:hypothetical protein
MLQYESINDGICKFRMKGRYRNITIISVHAPNGRKRRKGEGRVL